MVTFLRWISDWVDWLVKILAVPIGIGFILIVFFAVLTRYVFRTPIITSIELARIGFIWSCFLGATICVKREKHIQFNFLLDKVGDLSRKLIKLWISLLSVGFFFFLLIKGVQIVQVVKETIFPALGYSQLWLYLPLPLCSAFMLIHSVSFLAGDIKSLLGIGEKE